MYSIEDKMDLLVSKLKERGWDIELHEITTGLDFIVNPVEQLTKEDISEILLIIAHRDHQGEEDTVSVSEKSVDEFYNIYKSVFVGA